MNRRGFFGRLAVLVGAASMPAPTITTHESVPKIVTGGGWATYTECLKKGDIFTIKGVYAVNPPGRPDYAYFGPSEPHGVKILEP